jgi:hypothetical protein
MKQWNIALLSLLCLAGVAACTSATGPDGTNDTPHVGTTYQMAHFVVVNNLDSLVGSSVVTATADKIFNFPLPQYGATFVDSSRTGKSSVTYRYLVNGDLAIHQTAFNINFSDPGPGTSLRSHTVAVADSFIVFPTGIKDDRGYVLADTIFHDTISGKAQTTTMRVVDSAFFRGPAVITVGLETVNAVAVELQQTITASATWDNIVRNRNATYRYNGWYSPRLGYMVQEQMLGAPGAGGTVVVKNKMTSYTLK